MNELCKRRASYEGEKVVVKRGGDRGRWNARTLDGELICVHQYRRDLQQFCESYGFDWEMVS